MMGNRGEKLDKWFKKWVLMGIAMLFCLEGPL